MVKKKKKKKKRTVAMVTQWQMGQENWILVSMGHKTSDGVWSG